MPVPDFSPGEVLTAAAMDSIGLWKVASTAFNGNGFSMDNVFTSNYTNYRILINATCTADADTSFRYRVGGSDIPFSIYQYASQGWYASTQNSAGGVGQTSVPLIGFGNGRQSSHSIDVFGPATANAWKPLNINSSFSHAAVGMIVRNIAGTMDSTSAMDGFSIVSANTLTGTCTVYGYRI
jgi:hypothetical protein